MKSSNYSAFNKVHIAVKAVSKGELQYVPSELQPAKDDLKTLEEIVVGLEAWPDKKSLEYTEEECRLVLDQKHRQESGRTRTLLYSVSLAASVALIVSLGIMLPRNSELKQKLTQIESQQIISDTVEVFELKTDTVYLADAWTPDMSQLDRSSIYYNPVITKGAALWEMETWPRLFVPAEETLSFRIISRLNCRIVLKDAKFNQIMDEVRNSEEGYINIKFPKLASGVYFYEVYLINQGRNGEELIFQNALYIQ